MPKIAFYNGKRIKELSKDERREYMRCKTKVWRETQKATPELAERFRLKVNIQNLEWKKRNPERTKKLRREYKQRNADVVLANTRFRQARQLRATPVWIDREAIKAIYTDAFIRRRFGEDVEVDHIVPLVSEKECGLHVPWNLQIIDAHENRTKSNKLILSIGAPA